MATCCWTYPSSTGATLNAVLFYKLAGSWNLGGLPVGAAFITFALLTEGALLFVAAQTGFLDGPRVLATMANDRWLPRRFSYLSNRLVTQDGVLAMGLAALIILLITEAKVEMLVVLYAINVFLTFTLSQLGMCVHWLQSRKSDPRWMRKLMINGLGCVFTGAILIVTTTLKFWDGGWITVLMTGGRDRLLHPGPGPLCARYSGSGAAGGRHSAADLRGGAANQSRNSTPMRQRR